MLEQTVGGSRQNDHIAAQRFEQSRTKKAAGAVIAVKHDFQPAAADRGGIDQLEDALQVGLPGVVPLFGRAEPIPPRT